MRAAMAMLLMTMLVVSAAAGSQSNSISARDSAVNEHRNLVRRAQVQAVIDEHGALVPKDDMFEAETGSRVESLDDADWVETGGRIALSTQASGKIERLSLVSVQAQHCTGDYGQRVGDPVCCGQSGTIHASDVICPQDKPKCTGFVHGSTWGNCQAAYGLDAGGWCTPDNSENWRCGDGLVSSGNGCGNGERVMTDEEAQAICNAEVSCTGYTRWYNGHSLDGRVRFQAGIITGVNLNSQTKCYMKASDCSVQAYEYSGCDMNSRSGPAGPYNAATWQNTAHGIDTFHVMRGCSYEVATGTDGTGTKYTFHESRCMQGNGGPGWDRVRSIRVFKATAFTCGPNCEVCNDERCTQCKNGKYLDPHGLCSDGCPDGYTESENNNGRVCQVCHGRVTDGRRRSLTCEDCAAPGGPGPGFVSQPERDDCTNIQNLCEPDKCSNCAGCMEPLIKRVKSCTKGGCYNPGTMWCGKLTEQVLACDGFSYPCFYKLMCGSKLICKPWKDTFCGGQTAEHHQQLLEIHTNVTESVARMKDLYIHSLEVQNQELMKENQELKEEIQADDPNHDHDWVRTSLGLNRSSRPLLQRALEMTKMGTMVDNRNIETLERSMTGKAACD